MIVQIFAFMGNLRKEIENVENLGKKLITDTNQLANFTTVCLLLWEFEILKKKDNVIFLT